MNPINEPPYLGVRYQIKYHKCNLDCPYCIAHWKDEANVFDSKSYQLIIENLKALPNRISLRIGVGGEVFTNNEILNGIKHVCNSDSNIIGISFSTNLIASWKRIIEPFIDSLDASKLGMGCTLHDVVIKDIDGFFERAGKIKKKGVDIYIGYVAIPQRIAMIKQYKQRCDDLDIPLIMNGLVGKLSGIKGADTSLEFPRDYTLSELSELKDLWDSPHSYKMLLEASEPKGMRCSAGHQYIYINHKGDVFPCGNINTSLGNIIDGTLNLQTEDTICPATTCWCGNENQALRIVDKNYERTKTLRIFHKKTDLLESELYKGYNSSIFER
jgi:MoaA/NifB/PqqE/SkfB family radical SAM enzyme